MEFTEAIILFFRQANTSHIIYMWWNCKMLNLADRIILIGDRMQKWGKRDA